jgi:hypothetical protein
MNAVFTQRCVLGLLAGSLAASAIASDLEVQLRPEVMVHGAQVFLGDVAYVRSKDLDSIVRLVQLPLGRAPHPGSDARLSRDSLLRWAHSRLGELAWRADWSGADEVLISSATGPTQTARLAPAERPVAAPAEHETVPAVVRGEWVTLLEHNGGIELESRAEALQDAQLGQPVRVRSAGASGSVVARVLARGRVEMGP